MLTCQQVCGMLMDIEEIKWKFDFHNVMFPNKNTTDSSD